MGIFETDPHGMCTFVNDRWCELAGMSPSEALGRGWARALHRDDRSRVFAEWVEATGGEGEARATGEFHSEYRLVRPDATELWVLGSASPVLDAAGTITGYLGSVVDITAHRKLQAERTVEEQRFTKAFDHAPIGIALVSPEGRWLRVNRALCDLTGYAEGELLAKTFQDITHPDDLETDLEQVRQMLAGEIASYQMEKRYFRADGRTIWVLLSVSLLRDEDGEPLHFISQIQDITERKSFERDLAHLADHDGADRPDEPQALLERAAKRARAHPPPRQPRGAALHRPGRLQGHQRLAGPQDRRRPDPHRGRGAVRARPRQRHARPARRRRVRRAADRDRSGGSAGGRRGALASRSATPSLRSGTARSGSRPASG